MGYKSTHFYKRVADIKKTILLFSLSDKKRKFSFTSGNLGAIPVPIDLFYLFISDKKKSFYWKNIFFIVIEFLKYVFYIVLPFKNVLLILRTFLRWLCNARFQSLNLLCVISIGQESASKDVYFSKLIVSMKEKFDFIKIVGGTNFRSYKQFSYIESALGFFSLILLFCSILFLPLRAFSYSLFSSRKINSFRLKLLYIYLSLKEINDGTLTYNLIIIKSISLALNNSKIQKVIFPMEGRNWEKLMVGYSNQYSVKSVGYIHCALTPYHLSLINKGFYLDSEVPTLIITPGKMCSILINRSFNGKNLRQGFFLRGDRVRPLSPEKSSNYLLFGLTGNARDSKEIMGYISKSKYRKNIKIRLNTNTSSYLYLKKYAQALNIPLFNKGDNDLPRICFFRSSSIAVEYLRLNVIPVYLNLNQIVSSNIFDLDNKFECLCLTVNVNFDKNLDTIFKKISLTYPNLDGKKIANYYLDQSYSLSDLNRLINLEDI
jgi:hypothetical protein